MGASSSFPINANVDIYFSYPEKNEYIERLMESLNQYYYTILESSLIIQHKNEISMNEISKYMESFIENSKFIFICISQSSIRSTTQTIEMNEIIDKYPKIQDKLVYLMMEPEYTPITNKELKCIVKKNLWYPLYDNDTLFDTTNKILTTLMKNSD
jgi:hypothetical protein